MSKSSKGSSEQPGKRVKVKSGLNKSILDQGWYAFRWMLDYKSQWLGKEMIAISPHYTSQTCSCCGYKDKDNRKNQAIFKCLACGFKKNADINAARNILTAGLSRDGLWIEPHKWSEAVTCGNA